MFRIVLLAACFCLGTVANVGGANAFDGRLVISSDGNAHDKDDIGASPLALALLAKAKAQNQLTVYTYNDHIWFNSNTGQKNAQTESILGARERFEFNETNFISAIDDKNDAYNAIADEINKSSADNPLTIVAAGPMHVVCTGIRRSDSSHRKFVRVISHSGWNDRHSHNNSCVWNDMKNLGVNLVHIRNQNTLLSTGFAPWTWLKSNPDPDLRWVYSRNQFSTKFDVSDSDMTYYVLTGDESGTPQKFEKFLGEVDEPEEPEEPTQPGKITFTYDSVADSCYVVDPIAASDMDIAAIANRIEHAETYLKNPSGPCSDARNQLYIIDLPSGTFSLGADNGATIRLINFAPPVNSWLVIRGKGMDETILKYPLNSMFVFGRDAHRIEIRDLTMEQNVSFKTSQGEVVARGRDGSGRWYIDLEIDAGFPLPSEIFDSNDSSGRFLKRYEFDESGIPFISFPENWNSLPEEKPRETNRRTNKQIVWTSAATIDTRVQRLFVTVSDPWFEIGDRIVVKSKFGDQAFNFRDSSDVAFRGVRWLKEARGAFYCTPRVEITDSRIDRPNNLNGPMAAMSTSAGGPQIGASPSAFDCPTGGHVVENNIFVAPGDDGIAVFYGEGSRGSIVVRNNVIRNGFSRGILIFDARANRLNPDTFTVSPEPEPEQYSVVDLSNNTVVGNPIRFMCDHFSVPTELRCQNKMAP